MLGRARELTAGPGPRMPLVLAAVVLLLAGTGSFLLDDEQDAQPGSVVAPQADRSTVPEQDAPREKPPPPRTSTLSMRVAEGANVDATTTGPTAFYAPDLGRELRYSDLTPSGSVTTEHDGQVIERLDITGSIRIQHDDVTIRAVRIRNDGARYSISDVAGSGASGTTIEYVEIDGGGDTENIGVLLSRFVLRHSNIYGQRVGVQFGTDSVLERNYIHSQAVEDGTHNTAASTHGSTGTIVRGNNLVGSTSAALSLYPRTSPIQDALVEENLFNGGSYCTYAGDTDNHPYRDENRDIRYIGNQFGTSEWEDCGQYGTHYAFNGDQPGNLWRHNSWAGSGEPVE